MRRLLFFLTTLSTLALAQEDAGTPQHLKVGIAGSEPFVVLGGARPRGFSVDVFKAVAAAQGLDYELVPVDAVSDAVDQVAEGKLDAAVGPISVTAERLRRVSFTQPYFHAGLSVLTRPQHQSWWRRLAPFFSRAFLVGLGVLLLLLLGVGALMWWLERRVNPQQFPTQPREGLGAGLWFALVTMSTVGYGDKAPVSARGRAVAGVWMLISMMFASSLTAGIAAALTVTHLEAPITRPADLRGKRVATVQGSTSVEFGRDHGAVVVESPELTDAVQALLDEKVDGVLFDRPMLLHHLRDHPDLDVSLSEGEWATRGYAFALPVGSERLHELNLQLLELAEAGQVSPLRLRWLGE